jgi:hypothetical protein
MAPSKLTAVKAGKISVAHRYCFYGPEGVGKSSLLADAPRPIVIDADGGTGDLDIPRYVFRPGEADGHIPRTYEEILEAIEDLTRNEHGFQTLGIDTTNALEPLLHKFMCARDSKQCAMNPKGKTISSILEYGYGKGEILAVDEWRALARKLDDLRYRRNMNIVLLGHCLVRKFKSPISDDYDRYTMAVDEKAAAYLRGWCDVTGFVCFEEGGSDKVGTDERVRGYDTGRRLMKLRRTAVYDAKTRFALPNEIELDRNHPWAPLAAAVDRAENATPAEVAAAIEAELQRLSGHPVVETARKKTEAALAANNRNELNRYLVWLKDQETTTETKGSDNE